VDRGKFSAHLLANWHGRMLHLVDPWLAGGAYSMGRENVYEEAQSRVAPFPGRFTFHRGFSTVVALVRGRGGGDRWGRGGASLEGTGSLALAGGAAVRTPRFLPRVPLCPPAMPGSAGLSVPCLSWLLV
jgi:hypothetical protein